MGFQQVVLPAVASVRDLARRLDDDLDVNRGGFTWWHDYGLDPSSVIGMMDYLCGLLGAVLLNLRAAALHLADLTELRYADDRWIRTQLRQEGGLPERTEFEDRRLARIEVHTLGVLRAVGTVLDTLAGVVIGVGGFQADLVKADLGYLQPLALGADYPGVDVRKRLKLPDTVLDPADRQGSLLRATRSSLLQAGPTDWLDWTTWSRNDLVHRASRTQTLLMVDKDTLARPLPRQPKYLEAHAMRTSGTFENMQLTEDSVTTLTGVVESVNASVVGTMLACTALWNYRREHPHAITQPAVQWRTGGSPRTAAFDGYEPGSATPPTESVVLAHPNMARRWQASKVLGARPPSAN